MFFPSHPTRRCIPLVVTAAAVLAAAPAFAETNAAALPRPAHVVQDRAIDTAKGAAMALAARRYFAFWNTGDESDARLALAPGFIDRTLPQGRPQGVEGPLIASKNFRAAVPDLKLEVQEMLLVGDRVVGRLRFSGHYTGSFQGKAGDGRPVDFIATDIYRIAGGRIAENWHLEDNLTLLQQLGVVVR